MIYLWLHYLPFQRDFPEFDGADLDMYVINNGGIFRDTGKCLGLYSVKHDATQERTAREIARFSEKDAEMWLKGWDLREIILKNVILTINTPPAESELHMLGSLEGNFLATKFVFLNNGYFNIMSRGTR